MAGTRLLLFLCLFARAALPASPDFEIRLHTKLNELLVGMRDEVESRGIPSETRFAEMLREKSETFLIETASFTAHTARERKTVGERIRFLTAEIGWRKAAQEGLRLARELPGRAAVQGLRQVRDFQNKAAQRGLVAFTVLFAHVLAGWVLPPTFILLKRPEWLFVIWAYPVTPQGIALSLAIKSISRGLRLRLIYGRTALESLKDFHEYSRRQLALISRNDVLVPVLRRFGRYEVAVSNPGFFGKLWQNFRGGSRGLRWADMAQTPDAEAAKIWQWLNVQKNMSANFKTALYLSYLSREKGAVLENLLKGNRRLVSRTDVPSRLFADLENWVRKMRTLTNSQEVLDHLRSAPMAAPRPVIWELWKEFGLPAFLENNTQMDLIERRGWSNATEMMIADHLPGTAVNRVGTEDVAQFEDRISRQRNNYRRTWSNRVYNFCFQSLSRQFDRWAYPAN
jgi:hypothetical protein